MNKVKLGEITKLLSGCPFDASLFNDEKIGLPLIRVRDVNSGFAGFYYSGNYDNQYLIKNGDILISLDGDFKVIEWKNGEALLNQRVCKISPKLNLLNREYLLHYLPNVLFEIHGKTRFTTVKHLSTKTINNIEIPLPPLPDQLHIANLLSKAENLIAQRKESIRLLDEFLKSTFLEMFGDPVRNDKGWETKPLGELCNIRRGASPRPINNFIGDEVPWIKIGDGTKGNDLYIESTQVSITKEGATKSVLLDEGSLVFANCGVSLGFARILKIKGCIHDGWLSFENIRSELDKIYLLKLLNNSTDYLRRIAPDGTQPNLNTGIMKNFKIILPPINLQTQFSQIVEKTEALKTQYQQSLQELENLYGSLSQRAFRGELIKK